MAESIIKIKRRSGFTVIPNSTLRDNRLSLKTRAILAIMLSVPDDWDYTISGLAVACGAGREAVRTALLELEANGYLTRRQLHDDAGYFSRIEYVVTDEPVEADTPAETGASTDGGDLPLSDEPTSVEPMSDNRPQQNKDYTNTPYSPPEGERGSGLNLFTQFWSAYPRKQGKEKAKRAWRKLKPDLALCRVMSAALERDKQSRDWRKENGAFIPYPATWLNGRRWEDEPAGSPDSDGAAALPEGGRWL